MRKFAGLTNVLGALPRRKEWLLVLIVLPVALAILGWKQFYARESAPILETPECAAKAPSPGVLSVGFHAAEHLVRSGRYAIVLYKTEGCLRVGQSLPFDAVRRDPVKSSEIKERLHVGQLEIRAIQSVPFTSFHPKRQKFLRRKLGVRMSKLEGRKFFVVVLERKSDVDEAVRKRISATL